MTLLDDLKKEKSQNKNSNLLEELKKEKSLSGGEVLIFHQVQHNWLLI